MHVCLLRFENHNIYSDFCCRLEMLTYWFFGFYFFSSSVISSYCYGPQRNEDAMQRARNGIPHCRPGLSGTLYDGTYTHYFLLTNRVFGVVRRKSHPTPCTRKTSAITSWSCRDREVSLAPSYKMSCKIDTAMKGRFARRNGLFRNSRRMSFFDRYVMLCIYHYFIACFDSISFQQYQQHQ